MERIPVVASVILLGLIIVLWLDLRKKDSRTIVKIITGVYVIGVMYFTLFSREPSGSNRINLILFDSWYRSLRYPVDTANFMHNLLTGQYDLVFTTLKPIETALLNIMLFIPFGYILPLHLQKKRSRLKTVIGYSIICSLCIEIIQTITSLGWFDIDDLFCNIVGSIIGFTLYKIGRWTAYTLREKGEKV